jgi:hypothetical protein
MDDQVKIPAWVYLAALALATFCGVLRAADVFVAQVAAILDALIAVCGIFVVGGAPRLHRHIKARRSVRP